MKFYAIKIGNKIKDKIVESWEECQQYVVGYPAVYKSFKTKKEASKYLREMTDNEVNHKLKIAKQFRNKRLIEKLQLTYEFYVPDYVLQEMLNNSDFESLCDLIDFAVENEHLSFKNAKTLKNKLKHNR